jgi:hypothetical protein
LETAFNIESLKNYHDPEYIKRKVKQSLASRFAKKKEEKTTGSDALEHLREKTEDK